MPDGKMSPEFYDSLGAMPGPEGDNNAIARFRNLGQLGKNLRVA
jgi:hypothetical protein